MNHILERHGVGPGAVAMEDHLPVAQTPLGDGSPIALANRAWAGRTGSFGDLGGSGGQRVGQSLICEFVNVDLVHLHILPLHP